MSFRFRKSCLELQTKTDTDELSLGESSTEQSQSNRKEETSLIDFDSCAPRASGRTEECNQTRVGELPVAESNTDDSQSNELFISEGKDSLGESSFTMAGLPVSGLISYSGAIAYSGNISHRSDSSTTSNRSFAFPVLRTPDFRNCKVGQRIRQGRGAAAAIATATANICSASYSRLSELQGRPGNSTSYSSHIVF
ncbi:hypothetical protein ACFE04_031460 [Oxalis oulophora]